MTEVRGRQQPEKRESLIEQTPPHAGPSALTLVQSVDVALAKLDELEADIGRPTSFTKYQREQLLRRREVVANMVN
jgi:hypothetical protein